MEVICIGNELLIGKVLNTNAHWLAQQITALGANLKRVTVIEDTVEVIAATVKEAASRKPKFIITTGGLGPTFDDKTMESMAAALNRKVALNPDALEMVKARMVAYRAKRGLPTEFEMTPPQMKMAMLPEGAQVVVNPVGTAPSICVEINGSTVFVLPGIPTEVEAIFNSAISPLIKQAAGPEVFAQRSIFAEDIFESRLAPLIDVVMKNNKGVYIKSHPLPSDGKSHVELHLTMTTSADLKPEEAVAKAAKELSTMISANGGVVR